MVHLLSSVKGIAAIFLMGAAIEGLTSFETALGLLLAALLGAIAALTLNAMNFRAANRRTPTKRSRPAGAHTQNSVRAPAGPAATSQTGTPPDGSKPPAQAARPVAAPTSPARKDDGR